jgi:hypothetical protein
MTSPTVEKTSTLLHAIAVTIVIALVSGQVQSRTAQVSPLILGMPSAPAQSALPH